MTFKEREEAFESKYKHDEDLRFRTIARRNKLMGLWVAEQLGLKGEEAAHYARTVVQADMKMPGDDDIIGKIKEDLDKANIDISVHRLHKRLEECFGDAKRQIMNE